LSTGGFVRISYDPPGAARGQLLEQATAARGKEVGLDSIKPPEHSLTSQSREETGWLFILGTLALFIGIRTAGGFVNPAALTGI
jgi:hypothetical protein